jgi:hypothetical protein
MVRGKWRWDGKKLVKMASEPKSTFHSVIQDTMAATWHPANGQYYDSKSEFRRVTKAHGCVEVGDKDSFAPSKPQDESRERKEAIRDSIEQLSSVERRKEIRDRIRWEQEQLTREEYEDALRQ